MNKILFCDVCKNLMSIENEFNRMIAVCTCGFKKEIDSEFTFSNKMKNSKTGKRLARDIKTKGFPHKCKKCGHNQCDIYDLGAPYADESNIYLYKCKKCKYVQRQADGSGNK